MSPGTPRRVGNYVNTLVNAHITGESFPPPPPPPEKNQDSSPQTASLAKRTMVRPCVGCIEATPARDSPQSNLKKFVHFFSFFWLSDNRFYSPSVATRMHRGLTRDHQECKGPTKSQGMTTLPGCRPLLLLPPPVRNWYISTQTPSLAKRTTVRPCVGCIETTPASNSPPIQKKKSKSFWPFLSFFHNIIPSPSAAARIHREETGNTQEHWEITTSQGWLYFTSKSPSSSSPHRSFPPSPTTPQTIPKQFQGIYNVSPFNILYWPELIRASPGSIINDRVKLCILLPMYPVYSK
jgi:hypothetical protein